MGAFCAGAAVTGSATVAFRKRLPFVPVFVGTPRGGGATRKLARPRALDMSLTCPRCAARLVPTWSGLQCPRLNACGRGGYVEDGRSLHPFMDATHVPSGVRA